MNTKLNSTFLRRAVLAAWLAVTSACLFACSDPAKVPSDAGLADALLPDDASAVDGLLQGDSSPPGDGSLPGEAFIGLYQADVHFTYTQGSEPDAPQVAGFYESEVSVEAGTDSDLRITFVVAGVQIGEPEPKCTLAANIRDAKAELVPGQTCTTTIVHPELRTFKSGTAAVADGNRFSMTADSTVEGTYQGKEYVDRIEYFISGVRK